MAESLRKKRGNLPNPSKGGGPPFDKITNYFPLFFKASLRVKNYGLDKSASTFFKMLLCIEEAHYITIIYVLLVIYHMNFKQMICENCILCFIFCKYENIKKTILSEKSSNTELTAKWVKKNINKLKDQKGGQSFFSLIL